VKQYHNLFPKDFIEEALKDAPGGVHIVLKGTTRDEVNLAAIGYRYSHKTILHFVLTENAGNTEPGDPYDMKYTDSYGNICTRYVDCPDVVSWFFVSSNVIDNHNQLCQDLLQLKKMADKKSFLSANHLLNWNQHDGCIPPCQPPQGYQCE
jgi:hypothetical protein